MTELEHNIIQRNLNKTDKYVRRDKDIFTEWIEKKITINECKYRWKINNNVPFEEYERISDKAFEDWLDSLGWF